MSITFPVSRNVKLTASGLGRYLLEQMAGYLMVIPLMLGWLLLNLFYGIKHILIGAVIFYFVGGTIAWILCWLLYKLGCAYLGHSV